MLLQPVRQVLALAALVFTPALALAADPPAPAEVLGKLHQSNVKEIEMGKLAQERGHSNEVKSFGKTLVNDHSAADKKVMALARQEKLTLPELAAPMQHGDLGSGPEFDRKFAQAMLEEHKRDVEDAKKARDATTNPRLKALLTELVPTLEKHRDTAEKLSNGKPSQTAAPGVPPPQR